MFHTENASRVAQRVKDIHTRDATNAPQYRKHRGELYPVYDLPAGLGLIEQRRGENIWAGWVLVELKVVTDMLILLGQNQPSYLSINERKIGRHRWIWHLSLHTTDPAAE